MQSRGTGSKYQPGNRFDEELWHPLRHAGRSTILIAGPDPRSGWGEWNKRQFGTGRKPFSYTMTTASEADMKKSLVKESFYEIGGVPTGTKHRIAVVSDIHDAPCQKVVGSLKNRRPDYITIPGDILYAVAGDTIYKHDPHSGQHLRNAPNALELLRGSVDIAPVLFSTGNHELYLDDDDRKLLEDLGVIFLDDSWIRRDELVFGGLSSPYRVLAGTGVARTREGHERRWKMVFDNVHTSWLDAFEAQAGYKILLCHHPEFYEMFLERRHGIDLILSGHAHGGQIRLFGRGLYAYGQGWLPKYSGGFYDGRLVVSRGLSNTSRLPRLGNPPELLYVDLLPME